MNRHVLALVVALLAVTSGCVGGIRAPTHDYSDDRIVQTVTGSDFDHRDVSALYERHWRLTGNASSMRGTTTMWRDGEVIRETVKAFDRSRPAVLTQSTRYENGTRVRQTAEFMNQSGRFGRYWQNASAGFVYGSRTGHRVGFQRTDRVAVWADAPHEPVVARFDYEYTGREHGAYVFEADSLKPPSELDYPRWSWDVEHATNASARLVVDDSGLIREFDVRVTLQEDGQTTSERFRVHVTDVNQTRVTPPEWVDQAV